MNYKMIFHTLGWILLFEAAFLMIPALTALIYLEMKALLAFLLTAGVCLGIGYAFSRKKPKNTTLRAREGFLIVSLSWIIMSIFGSAPFMLTGVTKSFIDAFFETTSGFTTMGATIFADVEILPRSIIMWRSVTHFVGGMGVLVFIMAIVPASNDRSMHIVRAEMPGPVIGKLVPKLRDTAKIL